MMMINDVVFVCVVMIVIMGNDVMRMDDDVVFVWW